VAIQFSAALFDNCRSYTRGRCPPMSARSTAYAKRVEADIVSRSGSGIESHDVPGRHGESDEERGDGRGFRRTSTAVLALIMTLDSLALFCSLLITGTIGWLGFAYISCALVVLGLTGPRRAPLSLRLADDFQRIVGSLLLPFVIVVLAPVSRPTIKSVASVAFAAVVLVTVGRSTAHFLIRRLRERGRSRRTWTSPRSPGGFRPSARSPCSPATSRLTASPTCSAAPASWSRPTGLRTRAEWCISRTRLADRWSDRSRGPP
jgi:hypothetical protein